VDIDETRPVGLADAGPVVADADEAERIGAEAESRRRRARFKSAVEWIAVIGGALVVALVIKTFLFQAFYIPSASMDPTLKVGDRVLVNKLSYKLHDVNRGDLVVFERPPNEPESEIKDLIKRVIALPGENVEGRDGRIFIDGEPLPEDYLPDGVFTTDFGPQFVPEDSVFVMGDNRTDSRDSRVFGAISVDLIVGRAFVRVFPLGDLGFL
jgi:signal peptidase I